MSTSPVVTHDRRRRPTRPDLSSRHVPPINGKKQAKLGKVERRRARIPGTGAHPPHGESAGLGYSDDSGSFKEAAGDLLLKQLIELGRLDAFPLLRPEPAKRFFPSLQRRDLQRHPARWRPPGHDAREFHRPSVGQWGGP